MFWKWLVIRKRCILQNPNFFLRMLTCIFQISQSLSCVFQLSFKFPESFLSFEKAFLKVFVHRKFLNLKFNAFFRSWRVKCSWNVFCRLSFDINIVKFFFAAIVRSVVIFRWSFIRSVRHVVVFVSSLIFGWQYNLSLSKGDKTKKQTWTIPPMAANAWLAFQSCIWHAR